MAETDLARRMAPAQVDDALEPLALPGVIADGDRILALHDTTEPVEIGCGAKHAPIAQTLILRAVVAVHARRVVEGRNIEPTRRWGPVLPALAAGCVLLAGRGVPHEHDPPLAPDLVLPLGLWRQGGNPPVRWIDDERRARTRRLHRGIDGVICPRNVLRTPGRAAPVTPLVSPASLIPCGPLFRGRKLSIAKLWRPFKGCSVDVEPDALQVRMVPHVRGCGLATHRDRGELQNHQDGGEHDDHTERLEQSSLHVPTSSKQAIRLPANCTLDTPRCRSRQ